MELSIIIPYIQEYPQILFTIRSIHEELKDIEHEILAIDNLCPPAIEQLKSKNITIDRAHEHINDGIKPSMIESMAKGKDWLKYIHYTDHFSNSQARNCGIINAKADIVVFIDAHCVPSRGSLSSMFKYYKENWQTLNGSIHLPLTYHILEDNKLIYKFVYHKFNGRCEYSFNNMPDRDDVFEVPCMSACGLMIHKKFFNMMGLFPQTGIYAGGEHFFNYCLSIMGCKKWVYAKDGAVLHHHGEKRDYNYTWGCYQANRAVANYMFGDKEWMELYVNSLQISRIDKNKIINAVLDKKSNIEQRDKIKTYQVISIEDWANNWNTEKT